MQGISRLRRHNIAVGLLFIVCLLFLLERGPYRAIRFSKSYDFSTVYAAARCWVKGENPYEVDGLKTALAEAGAPPSLISQQDVNACLYFITAMPLVALVAWLPWDAANVVWCLLLLACFAASLLAILKYTSLPARHRWIIASLSLLFCPTYVGLMYGNPSVLAISVIALAICFAIGRRTWMSGLLLGITLSLKPQIALCALCVLILWRYWRPIWIGLAALASAVAVSALRAPSLKAYWQWLQSHQQNIAITFGPGGKSDPSPGNPWSGELLSGQTVTSLFTRNSHLWNALLWIVAAAVVLLYFHFRKGSSVDYQWRDVAFFCALTTMVAYHRYYDAQIFLLLIPLLVQLWKAQERKTAVWLGICLLLLAFPSQSMLARLLGAGAAVRSLPEMILLRHQPLAVFAMGLILAFSWSFTSREPIAILNRR